MGTVDMSFTFTLEREAPSQVILQQVNINLLITVTAPLGEFVLQSEATGRTEADKFLVVERANARLNCKQGLFHNIYRFAGTSRSPLC